MTSANNDPDILNGVLEKLIADVEELKKRNHLPVGAIVGLGPTSGLDLCGGLWAPCDGRWVRDVAPELRSSLPSKLDTDGVTLLYQLPDLRGQFLRGHDPERQVDREQRALFSRQEQMLQAHSHTVRAARNGNEHNGLSSANSSRNAGHDKQVETKPQPGGGHETRPVNVAVNFAMRVL